VIPAAKGEDRRCGLALRVSPMIAWADRDLHHLRYPVVL
jgi:hypothetical protein